MMSPMNPGGVVWEECFRRLSSPHKSVTVVEPGEHAADYVVTQERLEPWGRRAIFFPTPGKSLVWGVRFTDSKGYGLASMFLEHLIDEYLGRLPLCEDKLDGFLNGVEALAMMFESFSAVEDLPVEYYASRFGDGRTPPGCTWPSSGPLELSE